MVANMTKNELKRITNGEGEYPYLTKEAKELSNGYQHLLKKRGKAENETVLSYRLRCLEELLEV